MVSKKRFMQLKFISSIFNLALHEIEETLGFETLTMIFRRVGEASGENIAKRLQGTYSSVEEFMNLVMENTIAPIIGKGKGSYSVEGDKITVILEACPYKKAGGFPIEEMKFFCHYTEGMLETAIKTGFPDKNYEFKTDELISDACQNCKFSILSQ